MWTLRRPHRSLFLLEEKDEKNDEQKQLKPTVHQIGSGPDAKPIRMEMDHDAGVSSDTFHRFGVVVGCTISTLKEVVHASPRGDLSSVHQVLCMT